MRQPPFHNALMPVADRGLEQVYAVQIPNTDAYQLINTAVWYSLHRLAPGYNCVANSIEGSTCYYLGTSGVWTQIFVLRLTTHAAKVCVYPLLPTDPIEGALWLGTNKEAMYADVARVFACCEQQIQMFRREAAQAESYSPKRPKANDWKARIDWLDTYHFDKSAEEQAKLLDVSPKTLANNRSILERQKLHRIRGRDRELSGT